MDNTNKSSKILWIVLGVIAIAVIVIAIVNTNGEYNPVVNEEQGMVADVEGTEDVSPGSVNYPAVSGSGSASISYKQALVTYADRRIQLNNQGNQCQAVPNTITYKNGTNIMIDNRTPQTRTVKLGSTFTIKGYGFKIVNLSSSTLPATWLMDCDSQQNIATVLIQR